MYHGRNTNSKDAAASAALAAVEHKRDSLNFSKRKPAGGTESALFKFSLGQKDEGQVEHKEQYLNFHSAGALFEFQPKGCRAGGT